MAHKISTFLASDELQNQASRVHAQAPTVNRRGGGRTPTLTARINSPYLQNTPRYISSGPTQEAIENFGAAMTQMTLDIADKKNSLDAQNAFFDYDDKRREILFNYTALEGKEALDARNAFETNFETLVKTTLERQTPAVQAKLAPMLNISRRNVLDTAAGHIVKQNKVYEEQTLTNAILNVDKKLTEFEDSALGQQYILERARSLFPKDNPRDAIRRQKFIEDKTLLFGQILMDKGDANTGMQFFESAKALGAEARIKADDLILAHMKQEFSIDSMNRTEHNRIMREIGEQANQEIFSAIRKGSSFESQKDRIETLIEAGILSISDRNVLKSYWKDTKGSNDFSSPLYSELLGRMVNINSPEDAFQIKNEILNSDFDEKVQKDLINKLINTNERYKAEQESYFYKKWDGMLNILNPQGETLINSPGVQAKNKAIKVENEMYLNDMINEFRRKSATIKTEGDLFRVVSELESEYLLSRFDGPINIDTLPRLSKNLFGTHTINNWNEFDSAVENLRKNSLGENGVDLSERMVESSKLAMYARALSRNGLVRETPGDESNRLSPQPLERSATSAQPQEPAVEPGPEETAFGFTGQASPEWQAMTTAGSEYLSAIRAMTGEVAGKLNEGDVAGIAGIDRKDVKQKAKAFYDSARKFGLPVPGREGLKDSVYAFDWQRDVANILNDFPTAVDELINWFRETVNPYIAQEGGKQLVQQAKPLIQSFLNLSDKYDEKAPEVIKSVQDYMVNDWNESMDLIAKNLDTLRKKANINLPSDYEK